MKDRQVKLDKLRRYINDTSFRVSGSRAIEISESLAFSRIADSTLTHSDLWRLITELDKLASVNTSSASTKKFLQEVTEEWNRNHADLQGALRLLEQYASDAKALIADGYNEVKKRQLTDPKWAIAMAFELKRWYSNVGTPPSKYIGKKNGFNEYVIRVLAEKIPQTVVNRQSAIKDIMCCAGFKVTRQLVSVTLRENRRRRPLSDTVSRKRSALHVDRNSLGFGIKPN